MTPEAPRLSWLERIAIAIAPQWTLKRVRARLVADMVARHYEAAMPGRRTSGWRRTMADPNLTAYGARDKLRDQARDLIRNNAWSVSAVNTICDHVVGWGISATPRLPPGPTKLAVETRWAEWADTAACDADDRLTFGGLQKLVIRTVVESGECLVRRRIRQLSDGLPIPLQLQVLEPDYLDTYKDGLTLPNGGRIIQGVEFNAIGDRVAYWLFREHPGSQFGVRAGGYGLSDRIPASEVLHIFAADRPGQARGVSWFAPIMLRLKDLDDYEDAALVKQKVAACLAVLTTDVDGSQPPLGQVDPAAPLIDSLEPGMITNLPPGRSVSVVNPPAISEHEAYTRTVLRGIAAGIGVGYEDLTGDYTNMPFSAARMSRIRHWDRVHDWRWLMLIPQFCDPVWRWAMDLMTVATGVPGNVPPVLWTAPPMPMVEPDREGLAAIRNVRGGLVSLSEAIRELGYDPETTYAELAADWKKLDALGLKVDSDPRTLTQAGILQGTSAQPAATSADQAAGEPPTKSKPTSEPATNGAGRGH